MLKEEVLKIPVIVMAIIVLVLFGVLGQATTHGYHCHWIRVGDSQVCQ